MQQFVGLAEDKVLFSFGPDVESDKNQWSEALVDSGLRSQCSVTKPLLAQGLGQQSVPPGRHAALAGQISAHGFTRSCGFRFGNCVILLHVVILCWPDFSALSPSVELRGEGSQMFRIQRGFGVVMIVVTILSGALRPSGSPEDAGFHNTGVVVDGIGHH